MANGDSPVSIANGALVALGEDVIASFTDTSKAARLCSVRYDPVRRDVLRATPWSCAKGLAKLAADAVAPAFNWAYAYPVPSDFLRLWDLGDDDNDTAWNWTVEGWDMIGGAIMTDNAGPLNVIYVRDLTDCTRMDSLLVQCISLALAADIAAAVTGSAQKQQQMQQALAAKLNDARLVTSQENSPEELDADVWLRSRFY